MPSEFINDIKSLIAKDQISEAIEELKKILSNSFLLNDVLLHSARWNDLLHQIQRGIISTENAALQKNQIVYGLLTLVETLEEKSDQGNSRPKFSLHHALTCDRKEQFFEGFLPLVTAANRSRHHFFYLYGGEMQAHKSLFLRCVNRLKGIDLDHLPSSRNNRPEVADFSITIPYLDNLDHLYSEISRMILAELGLDDREIESLSDNCIVNGLARSSKYSQIGREGKLLFHLSINEGVWHPIKVPSFTLKFIENFCLKNLSDTSPEFFFFFSVEYDDDNQMIQKEIETALSNSNYMKSLGELKMVNDRHVEEWFGVYKDVWETTSERKAMKKRYFGDPPFELYMEEVQIKLKKVIHEINGEKHDRRS